MKTKNVMIAAAVNLSLCVGVANAQNPATETIVVEGKRAYFSDFENLEVPQSEVILDAELLLNAGVLNLDTALDLSASVARQNNFGGLWNSFSVRGFSGDINLPSGFLLNGFNAGRGFAGPRDIAGIESVEVLKGPRGALFGRGEPGGTVNLVTKRPKFETSGEVQATIGSWNQQRVSADYQTVLGENEQVGFRIVGFFEDAESFRDTVETQKFGLYPSVVWQASDNTRLTYELEYTDQAIPQDRGVSFTEEFGFTPRRTFTGEPGDGPIDLEVVGHQFEVQHDLSDTWSVLAGVGFRETSLLGDATEPNFDGRQTLFLDGQTLSRFFRSRDFDSDYTVLRAELEGEFNTGSLRHRFIVGADYDEFESSIFIERFRGPFIGTDPSTDISTLDPEAFLFLNVLTPVFGQFDTPIPGPNTDTDELLQGFGIYVQDQIDITDRFQIRLGARFDDFEQELNGEPTIEDTRVSPQVGAVYLINDSVSVYASYGEGFRQQTGTDFMDNQFDPNITESTEIGIKAQLDIGTISLTAFQVDQSNNIVNDTSLAAQAAGGFNLAAAGEAESQGIEFDANLTFGDDFNLWVSYAYTDAVFTSSNPDSNFGALVEAGDQLINSPENQLSVQVSKGLNIAKMPVEVGAGVLYVDERAGFTGFDFNLPSYTTARVFGEIRPSDKFAVRIDVDNVFDETFFTNSFANVWVQPGTPRQFRLTASYFF